MNSRMIRFWDDCHLPYQIMWMVMLDDITGPMWYLRWTNSDDPSYFLEDPNSKSAAVVTVVVFWGQGRHAFAPPARMRSRRRLRPSTAAQWWRMVVYGVEIGSRVGMSVRARV